MERVTCDFCGLPFSVRSAPPGTVHYCCSGCALASRIPVPDGPLPVSPALVAALALGFGTFNQILFAVLGAAVVGEGRADVGGQLITVSLLIGALLLLAYLVLLSSARPWRGTDLVGGSLGLAAAALAASSLFRGARVHAGWILLAANLWFVFWLARGWLRRAVRKKRLWREST